MMSGMEEDGQRDYDKFIGAIAGLPEVAAACEIRCSPRRRPEFRTFWLGITQSDMRDACPFCV